MLTDELREKFGKAETIEERKEILHQADMDLTDDELEMVSGGARDDEIGVMKCPVCNWKFPYFKNIKDDVIKATENKIIHEKTNHFFPFGPR